MDKTLKKDILKIIVPLWAVWAALLMIFQGASNARIRMNTIDRVMIWTTGETGINQPKDRYYINQPFLNGHVSMDSEFYLSIACGGYDDRSIRSVRDPSEMSKTITLNYAFFPLYPLTVRFLSWPFWKIGLDRVGVATAMGVLVSLMGALLASIALYDITRNELGKQKATTAVFFFLIFPSAFFLGQVYTEGLFCGLAFAAVALGRRGQWLDAAMFAAAAVLTRGTGMVLIPVLGGMWGLNFFRKIKQKEKPVLKDFLPLLTLLIPVAAYFTWRLFNGYEFEVIHNNYFSRGFLMINRSFQSWARGFGSIFGDNPQTRVYYSLELGALILVLLSSILMIKKYPGVVLLSLGVFTLSFFSGVAQGLIRYVLPAPSIYIMLAHWSRNQLFNRGWTMISLLLFGMLTSLFTANMWVG